MSRISAEDLDLLTRLSKRLDQTANVETGTPTNMLFLVRDLRSAFREAGLTVPGIADLRPVAEHLLATNSIYRREA